MLSFAQKRAIELVLTPLRFCVSAFSALGKFDTFIP
jgi:hypothetical protein